MRDTGTLATARLAAPVALILAVTGCTGGPDGETAEDAAGKLATALTAGKLSSLSFTGGTPREAQRLWTTATAGLGDSKPRVEVARVTTACLRMKVIGRCRVRPPWVARSTR